MINSKVKFYFYKKKGNENNIKHIERILLSELQWGLTLGRRSPEGGKAILFLGCTAAALRKGQLVTKQKPPMLIPQRAEHAEGDSGGLLCRGVGAPWHTSAELSGGGSLSFQEYSGFCFACDNQVIHHSCRESC